MRALVAAASVACALGGCDPFHTGFDDLEEAHYYRAAKPGAVPEPKSLLRAMNYNVKFGGGRIDFFFDCFGDRVLMTKAEVTQNLERLATKIRQVDPDILVVQEVDVNSKRAAYVDQMQWLLDHTALDYGVYASQWKADYVPSDGIGAVDSGNGILSKYPISGAERIALALRTDQSDLERYFYLKRNILRAKVAIGATELVVVAIHAEAYAKDGTKKQHIDRFKEELDRFSSAGELVLGAGDLNTLPPGSAKQNAFPDSVCTNEDFVADDYRDEASWLEPLYEGYEPEIPLSDYQADNARYFSHTTDKNGFWNRKLDYFFTNTAVVQGSGLVHQDAAHGGMETMPLSDHAPVSVEIELE
ncbi:MAG TPA: endonuclease/exonuclease/phosphatase family protein [Polyangiaceae bacterium]|nr:endonuclease/exonuclease/phosphatase family protein [Polyangiaceae bacterium]